jgi:hypothetical protein
MYIFTAQLATGVAESKPNVKDLVVAGKAAAYDGVPHV